MDVEERGADGGGKEGMCAVFTVDVLVEFHLPLMKVFVFITSCQPGEPKETWRKLFRPLYTCASYMAGRRCLLMCNARSSSAIVYARCEAVRCELMTLMAFLFFLFLGGGGLGRIWMWITTNCSKQDRDTHTEVVVGHASWRSSFT